MTNIEFLNKAEELAERIIKDEKFRRELDERIIKDEKLRRVFEKFRRVFDTSDFFKCDVKCEDCPYYDAEFKACQCYED